MKQITREQFAAAIEAGITVADLDPQEEEALLFVAMTAKTAGTSYLSEPGCPATQAGLCSVNEQVRDFAYGYDDYLRVYLFSIPEPFQALVIS